MKEKAIEEKMTDIKTAEETCLERAKVLQFLKGTLPEEQAGQIEEHIEGCQECSALVEGYLAGAEEIAIPRQSFQGEEGKLKEQAVHYEKGTRRIVVFTIVGMIMGWFSKLYVVQEFFPIKLILCVPYKISEILYRTLGGWGGSHIYNEAVYDMWQPDIMDMWGMFPFAAIIGGLAEWITPVLIGGAIYGSLAYFTGDKRIFTLTKYLKFAGVWAAVLGLYVGILFGAYPIHLQRLNDLNGINRMRIHTEWGYLFLDMQEERGQARKVPMASADENGDDGNFDELAAIWYDALFVNGQKPEKIEMQYFSQEQEEGEYLIHLETLVDSLPCRVNPEEKYMRTIGGEVYRISDAFAEMMKKYGVKEEEPHAKVVD